MTAAPSDDLRLALDRLQQSATDQRRGLEELVRLLRSRLGIGSVRVARRGIWLFGRLESAQFVVGDHSYRVSLRGGQVRTEIGDAVGGVGLTPASVPWSEWVQRITAEIDAVIGQNPEPEASA
jgi:hypothetical protein